MNIRGQQSQSHARAGALELACHQDLFDATPPDIRATLGWRCEDVGGALVSLAANAPSILFNRTIGLGRQEPASAEAVDEIQEKYAKAGVERYFVHIDPQAEPPQLRDWLTKAGLEPQRRWVKFERDARPVAEVRTALHIARIEARHSTAFGRIVADGFDLGASASELFPPVVERPGWHLLGAFDADEPVAAGVLFVRDGIGYLNFAATAPSHRRKGAQRALLAARIDAARELGCTQLFTETGEAVPGDPQHSYHNIERAGFAPAYRIDNYAPKR